MKSRQSITTIWKEVFEVVIIEWIDERLLCMLSEGWWIEGWIGWSNEVKERQ